MKRAAIDWDLVRTRLRASEAALEEAATENPARLEATYRERAARLAKVQARPKPAAAGLPALIFRLNRERYAIELKDVAEVLPLAGCTPVPGSPPEFLGVINLRGELRAVLDLSRLLALSGNEDGPSGFVLMLRRLGREIGLKVDRVEDLLEIRPEELTVPAEGKYVKALTSDTLILLNVDAVLDGVYSKNNL
jgi:purine-binding chemotaxis protein CheW